MDFFHDQRKLMVITIVLAVLFLIFQSIRWGVQASANRNYKQAMTAVKEMKQSFETAKAELIEAKKRHLPAYLEGFDLKVPEEIIIKIDGLSEEANKIKNPIDKNAKITEIRKECSRLRKEFKGWHDEIVFLDNALAQYKQCLATLPGTIKHLREYLAQLEANGYFKSHFASAYQSITLADRNQSKAEKLFKVKFQNDLPDYRLIYVTCLEGEKLINTGTASADAVLALRKSNDERIVSLPARVGIVAARYNTAVYAANQLERYPSYRMLDQVRNAYNDLRTAQGHLLEAGQYNSMKSQEFDQAKQSLDRVERIISESDQAFSRAQNKWQQVQNAVTGIPGGRSEARSAINRASSRISQWSENSQSTAESTLSSANTRFREGAQLEYNQPIESLDAYAAAKRLADQAYDEVDTTDHTPPPSSYSGSDDSYGTGGGSSSDYSSPSSPGGYSGSSGSYDSSPSGSFDSTPSGSADNGGL